ncbi:unnamed protein product, partial [Iphiclides podalirius]
MNAENILIGIEIEHKRSRIDRRWTRNTSLETAVQAENLGTEIRAARSDPIENIVTQRDRRVGRSARSAPHVETEIRRPGPARAEAPDALRGRRGGRGEIHAKRPASALDPKSAQPSAVRLHSVTGG